MTEEEKIKNNNPGNKFECPVCNCVRGVRRNDMHKFSVMDDGTEIQDY